jgi:hypothetical protein
MNASADVSAAPLVHRLRVADKAANEQDEETKPSSAARPSCAGVPSPSRCAADRREMKTWIAALTAYPRASAQAALQNSPAPVARASLRWLHTTTRLRWRYPSRAGWKRLSRAALTTTLMLDSAMAAAAIIGESRAPVTG